MQQELGDRYGQADTLDSLGYTHHHLCPPPLRMSLGGLVSVTDGVVVA